MSHDHSSHSTKNIKIAFFLNLFFTGVEFVGGFLTNSVAIMSDALHDLGDSFSLGMAWFLQKFSDKKRTAKFSYGYRRFSLLGAFLNAVVLLVGSIYILIEATARIANPESTSASGMFFLAIFGIAVNGFAAFRTSSGKTMNEKVVSLHLLEDVLGWVAVLVVSVVMIFTNLSILDPILSIGITLYILLGVWKNLKSTVLLFLQATPEDLDLERIERELQKNPAVKNVHDTHIWSLDGENHVLSAHIVVEPESDFEKVRFSLKSTLKKLKINHSTLEIECDGDRCDGVC